MKYLLIPCLLLSLFSCSKSDTAPPDPIVSGEPLLKELVFVDSTQAVPFDTLSKAVFVYDANKRLINIISYSYNPLTMLYGYRGGIDFSYSAADTVPFKSLKTELAGIPVSVTSRYHHYYFYDTQDRLIKDSVQRAIVNAAYDSSVFAYEYQYGTTVINQNKFDYYPTSSSMYLGSTYTEKDTRSNIIRQGTINPWYYYEYDSKLNPLRKTNPMKVPYIRSSDYFWANVPSHIEQFNNFKKIYSRTYDVAGNMETSTILKEIIIIYNTDGSPANSRGRSFPASSQDKYKFVYRY